MPPGIGSHVHWDRRLDARLGAAILSIQAVKGVSIGDGIQVSGEGAARPTTRSATIRVERRFTRPTNRAGGIEGGMTNGEIVRLLGYLKPLATLPRALPSIDLVTKEPFAADVERTDTVPIVAAGVVGEAMASLVLADALLEKFGGDALVETRRNLDAYVESLARLLTAWERGGRTEPRDADDYPRFAQHPAAPRGHLASPRTQGPAIMYAHSREIVKDLAARAS